MKKIIMLLILAVVASFAYSQEDDYKNDDIQTIFSRHKSNGGYGAFSFGYSQIDGKDAFITGARGAFIFDHWFAVGIGAYGFVNDLDYHNIMDGKPGGIGLAGGYGGIFIEPILASRLPVHISFPVLFGFGGVAFIEDSGWMNHYDFYDIENDSYLVVEPALEIEFNLTRHLRTAFTASYRFTTEIDLFETDPDVLNGLNMGLTFKIGKF